MRWLPKATRTRTALGALAALLLVGAVVGSTTSPDDGPAMGSGVSRARSDALGSGGSGAPTAGPHGVSNESVGVYEYEPAGGVVAGGRAAATASGGGGGDDVYAGDADSGGRVSLPGEEALGAIGGDRIMKSATLELGLGKDGLRRAHSTALRLVGDAGGFVQSSSVSDGGATLTLRVPTGRFEAVLADLRNLGKVRSEGVSGEDVTEEFVDIDARLRHWKAQEAVFLELMTRARSITETIEVRRELSSIQQTIEQLEGRRRFLDDRVDLGTITLELAEPGAAIPAPRREASSLAGAWDRALDAGESVIGGTIIVLGALVPLAVILGVPGAVVWGLTRRREPIAPPAPAT